MNSKISNKCYKILKLDSRASRTEVELAYDTLINSKNTTEKDAQNYKFAFEYLMSNLYPEDNLLNEFNEVVKKGNEPNYTEDEIIEEVLLNMPQEVEDSVAEYEEDIYPNDPLTDKVIAIWSTMKVNLPMLYSAVKNNKHSIFGITYWTNGDMKKIMADSCINPLAFKNMTFIYYTKKKDPKNELGNIYYLMKDLKCHFTDIKDLCKRFKLKRNRYSISGSIIAEEGCCKEITNILNNLEISPNISLLVEED